MVRRKLISLQTKLINQIHQFNQTQKISGQYAKILIFVFDYFRLTEYWFMEMRILKPRKALNKAFLKVKPIRAEIEKFKYNLTQFLNRIDIHESEEFHKNLVSDFLKKTYFEPNHFINTRGRYDLVVHNGNNASTSVGVIIEAKNPVNRAEMPKSSGRETVNDPAGNEIFNVKSFQELILYYLRERIVNKNLELKQLIITNIYEWYIFDANTFEKLIVHDKNLIKQFNEFENGRLSGKTTDFFYNEIADPFISKLE
jgi:adenine-specific DNA-methyltransferase